MQGDVDCSQEQLTEVRCRVGSGIAENGGSERAEDGWWAYTQHRRGVRVPGQTNSTSSI